MLLIFGSILHLLPFDRWDRLCSPCNPELDRFKKVDGRTTYNSYLSLL